MNNYLSNLTGFKDLIERYTIADLRSMVYGIPVIDSGGCCYPAIQALFSLIEMLGKLLRQNVSGEDAFVYVFTKLGDQYHDQRRAYHLYDYFRNGIAHTSLAKSEVAVKKTGDKRFHFSNNGNNLDIRLLLEDFLCFFNKSFDITLLNPNCIGQYESNLRDIFTELNLSWTPQYRVAEGGLDISADYTRTDTSVSGTNLNRTLNSTPSVAELSTGESKTQIPNKDENRELKPRRTWWEVRLQKRFIGLKEDFLTRRLLIGIKLTNCSIKNH